MATSAFNSSASFKMQLLGTSVSTGLPTIAASNCFHWWLRPNNMAFNLRSQATAVLNPPPVRKVSNELVNGTCHTHGWHWLLPPFWFLYQRRPLWHPKQSFFFYQRNAEPSSHLLLFKKSETFIPLDVSVRNTEFSHWTSTLPLALNLLWQQGQLLFFIAETFISLYNHNVFTATQKWLVHDCLLLFFFSSL